MRLLLFIFLMLCCNVSKSQVQQDTLHRRYLVCTDQYKGQRHIIIREGRTLLLKDHKGRKCKGKLRVINDSTICLNNAKLKTSDTFLLRDLKRIRRPHAGRALFSAYVILGGLEGLGIGAILRYDGTYRKAGTFYMVLGALEIITGVAIFNGPHYRYRQYRYRIVETKGYKLEKKHLRPARQKMF